MKEDWIDATNIKRTQISFFVGESAKPVTFNFSHNLAEHGLKVESALDAWLARTRKHTAQSFINYIKNKNCNIYIKEEKQWTD